MGDTLKAKCGDDACGHSWIIAYLPMSLEKVAKCGKRAICPKCGNVKVFVDMSPEVAPDRIARPDRGPYPPFFGSLSSELLVNTAQLADARATGGVSPAATAIYALLDYCKTQEAQG